MCRYRRPLCVTLLANVYSASDPSADDFLLWLGARDQVVGGMQYKRPESIATAISELGREVANLFPGAGVVTADALPKAVKRFRKFYHHATPFDPEKLREAVRQCERSGSSAATSEVCRRGRMSVYELLGTRSEHE